MGAVCPLSRKGLWALRTLCAIHNGCSSISTLHNAPTAGLLDHRIMQTGVNPQSSKGTSAPKGTTRSTSEPNHMTIQHIGSHLKTVRVPYLHTSSPTHYRERALLTHAPFTCKPGGELPHMDHLWVSLIIGAMPPLWHCLCRWFFLDLSLLLQYGNNSVLCIKFHPQENVWHIVNSH